MLPTLITYLSNLLYLGLDLESRYLELLVRVNLPESVSASMVRRKSDGKHVDTLEEMKRGVLI